MGIRSQILQVFFSETWPYLAYLLQTRPSELKLNTAVAGQREDNDKITCFHCCSRIAAADLDRGH